MTLGKTIAGTTSPADTPLSYLEAMDVIGGLSNPSKMPWYSWSTSAQDCITGSKLREIQGSKCSDCYACKGCYVFKSVKLAHERRLVSLSHPRFVEAFVTVLTNLYQRTRKTYTLEPTGETVKENRFRWHDSGDLQSVEHLDMINTIALQTPFIRHWLPTREFGFVKRWLFMNPQGFAPNLVVRMSAVMIGETFPHKPMGLPYSTVGWSGPDVDQCKAYTQEGMCKDCDACWCKDVKGVNYPQH